MTNQEFVVNEETLSDNSVAFNVVAFHGNSKVTFGAVDAKAAQRIADMLNGDDIAWMTVDVHA